MSRVPSLSSPFLLGFDEIERVLDRVAKVPTATRPTISSGCRATGKTRSGCVSRSPLPDSHAINSMSASRKVNW